MWRVRPKGAVRSTEAKPKAARPEEQEKFGEGHAQKKNAQHKVEQYLYFDF
jgi:hypothetical protein